jgi:hypothetical protein
LFPKCSALQNYATPRISGKNFKNRATTWSLRADQLLKVASQIRKTWASAIGSAVKKKASIFSTYGISKMSLPKRCMVDGSATAASMVVLI